MIKLEHVVLLGENAELSSLTQQILFSLGYGWTERRVMRPLNIQYTYLLLYKDKTIMTASNKEKPRYLREAENVIDLRGMQK